MNEFAPLRANNVARPEFAWTAQMVRPTADAGVGHPACFLRKEFEVAAVSGNEVLRITALGLYRAFINGKRVGDDLLTPGWTVYDKRLAFQTYSVGDLLKPGRNVIDIWLADGWYRSQMMWKQNPIYNTWGNEIAEQFGETTPMFPAAPPNFVTEPLPHFIHAALQAVDGSVIFRQVERGNVIVGFYPRGPADRVRNRAPVPPAKALLGLANMARVVPLLRGAQVIRVWAGIEGYLPDMLPVMGWSRTTQRLLHAFGFCGHGFQLSPGVGYTLAEMIDEGQAKIPIDAFAIDRFARSRPDQERLTGEFDAALASAAMAAQAVS